ncbi:cytochrome b [Luteibacter sp. NPDC031894]|jgi:cytochrome b561|uniref:cytochrome b n=1 Tax=Luteibacter sp. NPDC031894 TaxID=3390572 RepID=UPI003D031C52
MATHEPVPARPRKLVALHWLTVLCVVAAATLILLWNELDGRALRQWLLEGHRHAGLLVLLLFFARVGLRMRYGKLQPGGDHPRIVRICAGLTHVALYALLLALPLLGWAMSSAAGTPVHFFGLTLPPLVGEDEDLADALQAWHVDAAWALLVLVTLHLGAALWHHFVLRDHTLRMMLPGRRR